MRNPRVTMERNMIRQEIRRVQRRFEELNSKVTMLLRLMDEAIMTEKRLKRRLNSV